MNILITENQFNLILEAQEEENFKPARYFDKIHRTNLSQTYDFGNGLSSNEVWKIVKECIDNQNCEELETLAKNLTFKQFPLKGVEKLPIDQKIDIILGMASELNVDDIIHFTVRGIKHFNNVEVNRFLDTLPQDIYDGINWVMSPETLKRVKPILMQYSNEF